MSGSAVGRQLALGAHPLPGRPAADVDGVGAVVGRRGALGLLEGPVGEQRVDLVDGPGQLLTRRQSHSRVLSLVGPAILSPLPQPVGDLAEGARRAAQHVEHPVAAAACAGRGRGRGRPAASAGRASRARSAPASAAPVTPQARSTRPSLTSSPAARARSSIARARATRSARSVAWSWSTRPTRSSSAVVADVASASPAPARRVAADARPVHPSPTSRYAARTPVACSSSRRATSRTVRAHADSEAGSPGDDAHDQVPGPADAARPASGAGAAGRPRRCARVRARSASGRARRTGRPPGARSAAVSPSARSVSATWSSQSSSTRWGRGSPVTTRQASTSSSAATTAARRPSSRASTAPARDGSGRRVTRPL